MDGKPWRIELLGEIRARCRDGEWLPLPHQKPVALLLYLAASPHRPHPREALVEILWPEVDPEVGRHSLRAALYSLRRLLESTGASTDDLFLTDRTTLRLNPAAFTTDLGEYLAAVSEATRAQSPEERCEALGRAAGCYRGEFLPGFNDGWAVEERERLLTTQRELVRVREELGEVEGALGAAREMVRLDPFWEEAHYEVMRLYAALGQPSACLRQYQELERLLREELNEAPSAQVRALAEELRQGARSLVVARSAAVPTECVGAPPDRPPTTEVESAGDRSITFADGDRSRSPGGPVGDRSSAAGGRSGGAPRGRRTDTHAVVGHLPLQLTRFFGRHEEIDWITRTLSSSDARLVTLTGPGGTGKTRLAINVAERLLEAWQGAVWFVPLADVPPPTPNARGARDRIAAAIAAALGLPPSAEESPLGQVVEALGRRPTLLVLDNFEHLVAEGAPLVRTLLERVPSLTCLVTSRQHLDLAGEQEFALLPLPTPRAPSARLPARAPSPPADPAPLGGGAHTRSDRLAEAPPLGGVGGYPAPEAGPRAGWEPGTLLECASVQLFVDRARAVRPAFQLEEKNAAPVAALCDRLEGLPLALELAAAWVHTLTPAQILERLSQRFALLVGHRRNVAARHQSLRAAIEWSYQLLSPDQRRFFAQLSVFRGGWTLAAAEQVTEEPRALGYLQQLQECSLVVGEEAGEEMRYRLLETLREFAAEQVKPEERRRLARRHAAFFLALAEGADAAAEGEEGAARLQEVAQEYDNLRAALDRCLPSDPSRDAAAMTEDVELGLALGAALGSFWIVRGYFTEGRRYLTALLARSGAIVSCTRARALTIAGRLAQLQDGSSAAAYRPLEEGLAMARALEDRPRVASILLFMADQAPAHLTATQGQALGEEALALYRELGDRRGTAVALITLGLTCSTEDARRSRAFYEEGVAALRELGSSRALAWACFHLSSACYSVGDYEPASEVGRECLALFEQFAEPMGIAACHARQGEIALAQGDLAGARRHFEKRREYYLDLGSQPSIAESEIQLADVELAEGNSEAAVARYEHALTLARDANAFGGVVRALTGLGFAALRRGDTRQAGSLFGECLSMDRDWHNPRIVLQCLEGRAGVLILGAAADPAHDPLSTAAAHPDLLWAARILGAAEAVRDRIGPLRPPPEQSRHDAWIATLRTSLRDADFTAAWEAGGALSWEEIMACALGEN